jgi:hypothetical protein
MDTYTVLFVLGLFSIFFFASETFQMVFRAETRSRARWSVSAGLLVIASVIIRIRDGAWWFEGMLWPAISGFANLAGWLVVFCLIGGCVIAAGDYIIDRVNRWRFPRKSPGQN